MEALFPKNRTFKGMVVNILRIFVILAMAFPGTGRVTAQEPTPFLVAFPEWESVEGYAYPLGVTVRLEIDDPLTEDITPDYFTDGTVVETGWGGNYVKFSFWGEDGYDLKTDDLVSLIYNGERLTHEVRNLSVTNIDVEADSIMGMAGPEEEVFANTYDDWGTVVTTTTLSSGEWIINSGLKLEYGSGGRAQIYDDLGNSTAVDWSTPPPSPWRDEFDGALGEGWYWVNENPAKWNLTENPGFLRIYAASGGSGSENLLLRPVAPGDFMIKTRVLFEPDSNYQFAGLIIWQDQDHFLQLGRAFCDVEDACVGNGLYFDQVEGGNSVDGNFATPVSDPSDVFLRLERRGGMVRAFYSHEGITWTEIGTHWIPEDFQVNAVGLTASQDQSGLNIPADFDFFELTEGWGFLPEGFHDYDSGDFPGPTCDAGMGVGGWAADPDDRETDLAIEVNIDGTSLPDWLYAGAYREDLDQAGVCVDGNCSFSTSLPGPFSLYEPHSVVVYAQDIPSGEWVTLSNSPKTFTCRTYDIYTFDPATGGTKQVTNLPDTHEYNPRWSPDGKKIVHDTWNTDWSTHGVYLTDVKTGISAPLAGAEGGSYPTWSPSGKWIAFDRGADDDYRLFIVPPTGGIPKFVTEDAFMATWAPNSQRLAFHRPSDGGIWTTGLKGDNETKVAGRGNGPAWSPDGEWIAFEMDGDIWKVRVNSNGLSLGDPIQLTSSPAWEGRPTWSNNSQVIAFHAGMGQDTDIWTIPAAGGTATWLTGAPAFGDYDPNYSVNGRYVSYSSFSPDGQAARVWGAAFSYDVGTWSAGDHRYSLEETHSVPEPATNTTAEIQFNVSNDAPVYNGYVLLRGYALRARVGSGCPAIDPWIRPDQNTRFSYGWMTDFPMTYAEALAHFKSMAVKAYWDDGMSADLLRHEIFSWSSVDWEQYVCSGTEAPPEPVLYIHYEYPDVVEGDYELGHTVQVTVFDSEGNTKATATVETMEMPHWGGAPGFRVEQWDGMEGPPDIQPGDVVRAVVDGGPLTVETRIGEISGTIDLDTNSITGTINAPWAGDLVNVMCSPWGAPGGASDKETTVAPDGVSQFTCTWDSSEWDIQPGETVGVSYWGDDPHSVANAISNPWIMAFPEANQVFGYGWPIGSGVRLSINDEEIATVTVEGAPWDENDIMAFFDFGAQHDLVAGDVVALSGSGMVRTHTIQNLAITQVDLGTDTVSGTADAGANIHAWVHGFGHDVQVEATGGTWEAYFGSEEFHLQPGMCGRAEIRVEGNNSTNVDWCIPNPHFSAFPEWEYVEGWDWPLGANIHLSIDDPATEANPDFEQDQPVVVTPWDPSTVWVSFTFAGQYDMKVGDKVTLTDGDGTRTHTVRNLAITNVDRDTDIIRGTADAGAEVHVWPHGYNELIPAAGQDGFWLADFNTIDIDLLKGMSGRTEIRDEFGNATAVDWYIPNTRFTVWPEQNYLEGYEWPDGALVSISVAGKAACSTDVVSSFPEWDPANTLFYLNLPDGCDIEVGDLITLSHESLLLTHQVQDLAIIKVDIDANTVNGTAIFDPEQYILHAWIHGVDESYMQLSAEGGTWLADFGLQGIDLQPGMGGRVELVDHASNATAEEWNIPSPPRVVVQITDDWLRAENFTPNGQMSYWVYDAEGNLLTHPEQTWQLDGDGYRTVGTWEAEYIDLVPGHRLVVSDGVFTKEIVLEDLKFDAFNTATGQLSGRAPEPFGRDVWVGIGWENDGWSMTVPTDGWGNWLADFNKPVPGDYWWVAAQIFDPDGDASEVRPSTRSLAAGNFYVAWDQANPEEVAYLSWKGSGNLTRAWANPYCPGDLEFFGNSWVSENEGDESFFFASLVGWGTIGIWTGQAGTEVSINSMSSGCPGSANFQIHTQYQFFEDELRANLMAVQRTFDFGVDPYAHGVRPFIPRLNPSDGFTQVLHPDASGEALISDSTCGYGCIAASWDGTWFAIHNPATGQGVIVQRAPSPYTAALWLDDDGGSFTNASSFVLLPPVDGFVGTVTETEYLCFYDSQTWLPSLTLPAGCRP